jgi:hypothetical protein
MLEVLVQWEALLLEGVEQQKQHGRPKGRPML